MEASHKKTDYAPPEIADELTLQRQVDYFRNNSMLQLLLDAQPNYIMILNQQRQVVFVNRMLITYVNADNVDSIYGMRPGEVLGCIHSLESESGCGTTVFCRTCGAVNAILQSRDGNQQIEECRIYQTNDGEIGALDLRVWATPFIYNDEKFTIFSLVDISHEKRREILERIFFHDILNTAGILQGFSNMLMSSEDSENFDTYSVINDAANTLMEEILAQKHLAAAETGDLKLNPEKFEIPLFIDHLVKSYQNQIFAKNKNIYKDPNIPDIEIETDRTILNRVTGNMLKNALEASKNDEIVTIGVKQTSNELIFWVHNKAFIPDEIRYQIFKRSFSTKGTGRGLGTYSIKLLTENYLKGSVNVESIENAGTTFSVSIPIK